MGHSLSTRDDEREKYSFPESDTTFASGIKYNNMYAQTLHGK